MRQLSIALRIKLGFAVCLLFFIISGLVSYQGIQTLSNGFNQYTNLSQESTTSGDINARFLEMRLASEQYLSTLDTRYDLAYQQSSKQLRQSLDSLLSQTSHVDDTLQTVKQSVIAFESAYQVMKQNQEQVDQLINVEMSDRAESAQSAAQSLIYESYNYDDANASLYAGMLMENFLLAKVAVLNYSMSQDPSFVEVGNDLFEYSLPGIEGDIASLESSDHQAELIAKFTTERQAYAEGFALIQQQLTDNALYSQNLQQLGNQLADAVSQTQAILSLEKQELTPQLQQSESRSVQIIVALAVITLVIGTLSALFVTRSITKGIAQVKKITDELSQGNLDIKMSDTANDKNEIGQLLANMNITIESLQDIVSKVNQSSVRIGEMSESLDLVTTTSSNNATELGTQMADISQSVVELTTSTSEIASSAKHASSIAQQAASNVEMGLKEVDQTLFDIDSAENRMQTSSDKVDSLYKETINIGAILEVIQGVTEQTNLLALNAAIEAARAGEHGRGFAVVADEVRTLAQRTQDSASQINDLITSLQSGANEALSSIRNSHETVTQASKQAKQASQNLHVINQHIQELSAANSQIATFADQQDHLTKSLEENAQQANSITESNTDSVQHISNAAHDLIEVAHNLEHQVNRFKY
ncbi:methyl-accepting chemotaxis protein [Vibrio maerlii]|uniref:methyl-accepting chemotaxis protein n=1 Tax=Vibrio maerlii TaxID=2231648 RepID=UPI000E3BDD89|nr:methyl-accepting chemotaxis protein [Vibrio maerlii]